MPSSSLSESQLSAFRQKAGPILAEARGLTPAALAKLGEVARDLGLGDDQVQDAIRSLHGSPKAKDPAVEKFRKRLKKDLSVRKTIIGPEIESRIVAGGVQKYSLPEQVILDVLAEVSAELGLRRITGNEALAHFVEMVEGAVGERTWLNRQAWDRLRLASEKWGLTFEDADQLVEQKLDANRRSSFRGRLVGWGVMYGSIGVVACVLVVVYLLMSRPKQEPDTAGSDDPPKTSASPAEARSTPTARPPSWWDYELAIVAAEARRKIPGLGEVYPRLISETPVQRGAGYRDLVNLGAKLAANSSSRSSVEEILVACHAAEPDESAAQELRSALLGLIPTHSTPPSTDASLYERAFWGVGAARLALQAKEVRPGRPAAMALALSAALGITVAADLPAEEQSAKCETALSAHLFQHLVGAAPRHPASALVLHQYLQDHGRLPVVPEEREPLEATYLAALLPAAEAKWRDHQDLLAQLVRSKNPLVTLRMADLLTKVSDRGLQSLLAEELVRHTGAKPRSGDPKDVARSVRQALGAAGFSSAQSQDDRWEVLRLETLPALQRRPPAADKHGEILRETVELARLATLAAALSQGEAGTPVFDELIVPAKPKEAEKDDDFTEEPAPSASRPGELTNRQKQQLEQYLTALRAFQDLPPIQRTGSFRALAAAAPQIPELTYDQAAVVARYLLAEKSPAERQGIQSAIAAMKPWKQLRLALADQLEGSKLNSVQIQEVMGTLLDRSVSEEGDALRHLLLLSVQRELGSGKSSSSGDASAVRQAAEQLAESYRVRARLAGVSAAELDAAESPGQVLELLVLVMSRTEGAKRTDSSGKEAGIAEQLEAARFLGTSDLRRTVLLQRLVVRAAVQRISALRQRQAEAAALILSDLETADARSENILFQLYHGEAATLKLGMLYEAN